MDVLILEVGNTGEKGDVKDFVHGQYILMDIENGDLAAAAG
jgi:hypothetical protein